MTIGNDPVRDGGGAVDHQSRAPARQRAYQVLHVEDNVGDVHLVSQAIVEVGAPITIHSVASVEAALTFLRRQGSSFGITPDLILLDLNLPAINGVVGLDLITLTDDWQAIPVIVFSSSASQRDRVACRRRGAADYWVKPSAYEGFLHCVHEMHRFLMQRDHRRQRTCTSMTSAESGR